MITTVAFVCYHKDNKILHVIIRFHSPQTEFFFLVIALCQVFPIFYIYIFIVWLFWETWLWFLLQISQFLEAYDALPSNDKVAFFVYLTPEGKCCISKLKDYDSLMDTSSNVSLIDFEIIGKFNLNILLALLLWFHELR